MGYNTFGWDTVYAIDVDLINRVLQKAKLPALDFKGTQSGIVMTGVFGPLQIVSGGSGKLLRLAFPIKSGTFTSTQEGDAPLDGVELIADVELALLPSKVANTQNLVPNIQSVSKQSGSGLMTPIALLDPHKHLSPAQWGLIFGLLPQYLVSIAGQLSFVLATVNFAKPKSDTWLAPVKVDYAYMEKVDGSKYLGILSVTTNRDISKLERNIDNEIVSGKNNAGLFISEALFMQHVIQPVLARAYPDAPSSTFHWNGREIEARHSFGAGSVKKGAVRYHPEIEKLSVTVSGNKLDTKLKGHVSLKVGITMTFDGSTSNKAEFHPSTKVMSFAADPHPKFHKDVHIPWYWAAGGPTVDMIIQVVSHLIGNALSGALKADEGVKLAKTPPTSIQWPNTTPIDISEAGLNGLFYMQGLVSET